MKKRNIFLLALLALMIMFGCDKCDFGTNPDEDDKPKPESPVTYVGTISLCVPEYGATSVRIILSWSCDDTSTALRDSAELCPDYQDGGFNVYKSTKSTMPDKPMINVKIPESNEYFPPDDCMEYHDNNIQSHTTYYYWITYVDPNGSESKPKTTSMPGLNSRCLPPVSGIQGTCNGNECVWTWDAYPEAEKYRIRRWDSKGNYAGTVYDIPINSYTWQCDGGSISVVAYLSWGGSFTTCQSEMVSCTPAP